MTLTNKKLRQALDMIDEGCAMISNSEYRDIEEHAEAIGTALDALWEILHDAENAPIYRPDPLTRAMFGTGEE